jgi:hypothetical protein
VGIVRRRPNSDMTSRFAGIHQVLQVLSTLILSSCRGWDLTWLGYMTNCISHIKGRLGAGCIAVLPFGHVEIWTLCGLLVSCTVQPSKIPVHCSFIRDPLAIRPPQAAWRGVHPHGLKPPTLSASQTVLSCIRLVMPTASSRARHSQTQGKVDLCWTLSCTAN